MKKKTVLSFNKFSTSCTLPGCSDCTDTTNHSVYLSLQLKYKMTIVPLCSCCVFNSSNHGSLFCPKENRKKNTRVSTLDKNRPCSFNYFAS